MDADTPTPFDVEHWIATLAEGPVGRHGSRATPVLVVRWAWIQTRTTRRGYPLLS
jgi:hypothetical protein